MMKPLYHYLDPIYQVVTSPIPTYFEITERGDFVQLSCGRVVGKSPLLVTNCYIFGDTLIDTGIHAVEEEVIAAADRYGVRQVLLTHHHEDHSGNARALKKHGLPVYASPLTIRLMRNAFPLPFYQHLAWGAAAPVELEPFPENLLIGGNHVDVIDAPGHAVDQVAFHVPGIRTLFSGDAYIHRFVRIFRRDEDFYQSLATCQMIASMDFDRLVCGHRPEWSDGPAYMREKVRWLERVRDMVLSWRRQGLDTAEMERRMYEEYGETGFDVLSAGDARFANMAHAILYGPRARPEVVQALGEVAATSSGSRHDRAERLSA